MFSSQLPEKKEKKEDYSAIDDRLRTAIDAQYGIIREKKESKAYPTGVVIVRNAKNAKEIADPTIDQSTIEQNNMLLRCLGRLRGIDHALKEMASNSEYSGKQKDELVQLRKKLSQDFAVLESGSAALLLEHKTPAVKEKILQMEKNFNTLTLCKVLHQANLDEGCLSSKDYKTLLFHYRNLSSLLGPVPSLVTVMYDKANQVLHRITQDPITRKLPQQKQAIKRKMSEVILFPTGDEMTFQTSQNMAMQVANRFFASLAARDDNMLGGQARKTHLHGIKNAFWVTNELVFDVQEEEAKNNPLIKENHQIKTQSFARGAMPVYVGKGETDADIQQSMRDNMEQLRQFIITRLPIDKSKTVKIHYTCLITDSPMEKQSFALGHIKRATRDNKSDTVDYSYVPCNWDGTHRRLDLSAMVDAKASPSIHPTPSNQAERYRRAAQVSVIIREKQKEKVFEFVGCMSSQDRTETEAEYASQEWARRCYEEKDFGLEKDPQTGDTVEATRAKGRNSADINAHVVGGAPGCKEESRGKTALLEYDNLYAPATDSAMYLASATMNKKNPVEEKKLQEIMAQPCSFAEIQYKAALDKLSAACALQDDSPMKKAGLAVVAEVTAAKNRVKPHDIGTLARILQTATHVVQEPKSDVRVYSKHVARLGAIAKKLNQKSGWKRLGGVLLVLGGVALVTAGVLFAVPSGGSSLLLTVLGAQSVVAAKFSLAAAAGVGGVSAFAGAVSTYFGSKIAAAQTRHDLEKASALIDSLGRLQRAGERASYVMVSFPPAFFVEYCSSLEREDVREQMKEHVAPIMLTDATIKESLADEKQHNDILIDIPRLNWRQQGESVRLEGKKFEDYQVDLMQKMSALKVTAAEANAILVIATTMQGKRMQGGAINTGALLLSTGLMAPYNIHVGRGNGALSHFTVRRQGGSLVITSTWSPEKASFVSDEAEETPSNPFQYSESYTLKREESGWQLALLPKNNLQVHPVVWQKMLQQAHEQLDKSKQLTKEQLFSYVPLLTDKPFAKVFAIKIQNDSHLIPAAQLSSFDQLILKCHGSHRQQPEHILRVRYEVEKVKEAGKPKHLSR